ncbi:hypothetical protein GIB67_016528, partial [Kingdonia uniflora]
MRSVGHLIDEEDITNDLSNICINTESVPLTQNHAKFNYGQSDQDYQSTASTQVSTGTPHIVPTDDHTTAPATCTSFDIPTTGDHTFTQTRRSTFTAKRQRIRPTAHVLDTGINVMTTELSRITSELTVRREFNWTMGSKVKAALQGITRFDMTYLFTVLEVVTKDKPFCVWFLNADGETRGYLRFRFGQIVVLYMTLVKHQMSRYFWFSTSLSLYYPFIY